MGTNRAHGHSKEREHREGSTPGQPGGAGELRGGLRRMATFA